MDFKPTRRGLLRAEFKDRYGQDCSIQESSFPDEDCLWVGVDVGQDGQEILHGRMHITKDLARQLIPMLRHFIRTGSLGVDKTADHFQIGAWVVGVGDNNAGVEGRIVQLKRGDYLAVQDHITSGDEGLHICAWDVSDLIWVPIETPSHIKTRYERIMEDDD